MRIIQDSQGLKESLEYLNNLKEIALDLETTGLLPTKDKITSLQLGNEEEQFIIDTRTINIREYSDLIKTRDLVIHNALFDLSFLYAEGIATIGNVYDTFLAESNIYLGLDHVPKSLDHCLKRHLNVEISKAERKDIHKMDIFAHAHLLKYAANDIKYLIPLKRAQVPLCTSFEGAIRLDNLFVSALAYIKYCGFKLDKERWMEKILSDERNIEINRQKLDSYVVENYPEFKNNQLNLFSTQISSNINWNSPQQVIPVFKKAGIDVSLINDDGEEKESINEKHLERQSSPLLSLYFEYKKAQTSLSKYGYNFLDACGDDDRIRTNFKQILKTGRMSSGSGKDNPNFQNITKKGDERKCFVPEPGNVFVVSDYSQQEQVILANQSQDPGLLEFFISGGGDMHSFVTQRMHPELRDLSFADIKRLHPEKRDAAKKAGFAINYGGNGRTIADNLGVSEEEGNNIYSAYFKAFPSIDKYFKAKRKEVLNQGYVLISPYTGRRSLIDGFEKWKKDYNNIDWDTYKAERSFDSDLYYQMKESVSKASRLKSTMQKKSLNYPVQGTGAEMMKYAGAKMFSWILKTENFNIVKMVNVIHDEYVLECPQPLAEEVADMVKKAMEDSSKLFCPIYHVRAEPVISERWTH